jgi:hypothetical protein
VFRGESKGQSWRERRKALQARKRKRRGRRGGRETCPKILKSLYLFLNLCYIVLFVIPLYIGQGKALRTIFKGISLTETEGKQMSGERGRILRDY